MILIGICVVSFALGLLILFNAGGDTEMLQWGFWLTILPLFAVFAGAAAFFAAYGWHAGQAFFHVGS